MKYTIPYEDKINLPHIKELIALDLRTGDIYKDNEDLLGKVIVFGEYALDNSEDVMEFTHEIPISLLVDDTNIEPVISFSNLEYELVKGRGVEIMFDLDVTLETREDHFQKAVDEKLDEVIGNKRDDEFTKLNSELNVMALDKEEECPPVLEEVQEEEMSEEEMVEETYEEKPLEEMMEVEAPETEESTILEDLLIDVEEEEDKDLMEIAELDTLPDRAEPELIQVQPQPQPEPQVQPIVEEEEEIVEEMPEEEAVEPFLYIEPEKEPAEVPIVEEAPKKATVTTSDVMMQFDIGFISNVVDKYTCYKILFLDEDECVEDVLKMKNLPYDCIDDGFCRNDRKVVLKIEDEE